MIRTALTLRFLPVFCFLLFVGRGLSASQSEVEFAKMPPFSFVGMDFRGALYRFEDFGVEIPRFLDEMKKQGLESQVRGPMLIIFFKPPMETQEVVTDWGLGYEIGAEVTVRPPLRVDRYSFDLIARTRHEGTLGTIYNFIVPYLEDAGYEIVGPQVLRLGDRPPKDRPDLFKAELLLPVRKKAAGAGGRS